MDRIPLYLVALIVAIANTPTNIYQICAWNHGTVRTEPWRSKLTALVSRPLRRVAAILRDAFHASGGLPMVAGLAALVLLAVVFAPALKGGVMVAHLVPVGLKALRQRDADLRAEIVKAKQQRAAIGNKAVEENRKLTDQERADFIAAGKKADDLQALIEENAELLRAAEEANEAERAYVAPPNAPADADTAASRAAGAPVIVMGEDRTTKAPGYFGRQLHAVRAAALATKGGEPLTSEQLALLKPMQAAATGANTDVPSEGGFLVSQERTSNVIQRAYQTGEILRRITPMPIGAGFNGTKVPAIDETSRADNSRYGGIVSQWLGQGNQPTSTGKPKFRELDLKLRKVGAFVYSTDEMQVDAVMFEAWVNRYLPLELQFRTEDAIVNGDGASKPLGLLNSPSVITVTRAGAGAISSTDLQNMVNRMWAPLWGNAVFLVDQSTLGEFDKLAISIGTAGVLDPSYKPAGSVPGQKYATYKNIPIIPVEYCAAKGTSGDIILTNFDEYMLIDKGGVQSAVSLHVAFLTDEAVFRFIYRVDGQPVWNAPLTPKSGGDTLSQTLILS